MASGVATVRAEEIPRTICDTVGNPEFFRRGNNSLLKQTLILLGQASLECRLARTQNSICLCDRTILDHWAYTIALASDDPEFNACRLVFESFLRAHMSVYDLVFLLRPEFPPVDDGTRESDAAFQQSIDAIIIDKLEVWGIGARTLSGDVAKRTEDAVTPILEAYGKVTE